MRKLDLVTRLLRFMQAILTFLTNTDFAKKNLGFALLACKTHAPTAYCNAA